MTDAILVNYNFSPDWIHDYDFKNVTIYDRSEGEFDASKFPNAKVIKTKNQGQVDYDKLSYLVDNYDNLPDVFLWGKSNLFKFITKEEFDKVCHESVFTPLLTQYHKTYGDRHGPICYYQGGMYYEINSSWYVDELGSRYCSTFGEFAKLFQLPNPQYIPFAPGGNYILTRETVHKYSRDYYDDMRQILPYAINPAEAHMCERAYYLMWR